MPCDYGIGLLYNPCARCHPSGRQVPKRVITLPLFSPSLLLGIPARLHSTIIFFANPHSYLELRPLGLTIYQPSCSNFAEWMTSVAIANVV